MRLNRLSKRLHAPLVCVVIANLFVVGCKSGQEEVSIPVPREALLAGDGTLLLSIYVERELQAERTGWHWISVEPEAAAVLTGRVSRDADDNLKYPVYIGWGGRESKAAIDPPLLDAGLIEPVPPVIGPLHPLKIEQVEGRSVYRLSGMSGSHLPAPEFTIHPSFVRYDSPGRRFSKGVLDVVSFPVLAVGAVIVVGYLLFYIAFDDSGLSPI